VRALRLSDSDDQRALRIVRAEAGDLDVIIDIREDAARWLSERGIEQWPVGTFHRQSSYIAQRIAAGEEYLSNFEGSVVGTLRLQWSDPDMWPGIENDAGYVHGFAVRREWAGRLIGRRLLQWAEMQIAAAGRTYLRLDCVAHNKALCQYYERAEFRSRGQVESVWGKSRTLHQRFEKQVAR